MSQPTVLVISETPGFSKTVLDLFHRESGLPSPTAVSADLCRDLGPDSFDLAIIAGLPPSVLAALLGELAPHGKTLFVLAADEASATVARGIAPRALVLRQSECPVATVMLLATEMVKRIEASNRLRLAEQALATSENSALLGRYITEMRHTINNALTSVMGNSELLLFDAGAFTAHHRTQIETIRTMSARIHEIMQRLSSLESEAKWMERQRGREGMEKQAAAGSL